MSFRRRLFLALTFLFVIIMSANFAINTLSARGYFSSQLSVLASDAATSLAFSISQTQSGEDVARAQSMIDAVFDSGYYLSINYFDLEENLIVSRSRTIEIENVPRWFIDLVDVPLSVGKAEVQDGWRRLGEVSVVAHPGFVVRDLWQATVELFWVYCFILVLGYGLMGLLLNYLTRPLRALEKHAKDISAEHYSAVLALPRESEFRSLAVAMNDMTEKVGDAVKRQTQLTHNLRKELSLDPVTKIPNREEFNTLLRSWLDAEGGGTPALMCLISLPHLSQVNLRYGREYADQLLCEVATVIKAHANKHRYVVFGRRSGTDFSIFLPGMLIDHAPDFLDELHQSLMAVPKLAAAPECGLAMGASYFFEGSSSEGAGSAFATLEHFLESADESLRRSVLNGAQVDIVYINRGPQSRGASQWRATLEDAASREAFTLAFQELSGFAGASYEVFCRIEDQGKEFAAAAFWPLLERFDLSEKMDLAVVKRTLTYLERHAELRLSVNVTPASALSGNFCRNLLRLLERAASSVRERLTIELREPVFDHLETLANTLLNPLTQLQVGIGIDGFGNSTSVISRIQLIKPAYLKLDRRFIQAIDTSTEERFYLRLLVDMCEDGNVPLIAEGVERAAQIAVLKEFGMTVFQGFYFGLPKNEYELELGMNKK